MSVKTEITKGLSPHRVVVYERDKAAGGFRNRQARNLCHAVQSEPFWYFTANSCLSLPQFRQTTQTSCQRGSTR